MGGFGAAVSFNGSNPGVRFPLLDRGLDERGQAGTQRTSGDGYDVWEARTQRDAAPGWQIESDRGLTVVGDVRLWDRAELSHLANLPDSDATSDRTLLLAAFREVGADMMDSVDGDFAFVIIDHRRGAVFAARDRFGARPLWYQASDGAAGIASEPGQLRRSPSHPAPDLGEMRRYQDDAFGDDDSSFLRGIRRLAPGHIIELTGARTRVKRYWHLHARDRRGDHDPAATFRRLLQRSVARRVEGSSVTASHLSGGLDSSAIVVAAADLVDEGAIDPSSFITVSAVTPGRPTDETDRISHIAASLPFTATTFEPTIADLDDLIADIVTLDTPLVHPTKDLLAGSARACSQNGATVLMTGSAGDDVVSDDRVLTEVLRTGHLSRWVSHVRLRGATDGDHWIAAAVTSSAPLVPGPVRRGIRRRLFDDNGVSARGDAALADTSDRNRVRRRLAERMANGRLVRSLELQESMYARAGIEVTHPFLDRELVEYVAALPAAKRPLRVGGKSLTRAAFGSRLTSAPTASDTKTRGDDLFHRSFEAVAPDLVARFPDVPARAVPFVDPAVYEADVHRLASGVDLTTRLRLWRSWTMFLWLEKTTIAHAR